MSRNEPPVTRRAFMQTSTAAAIGTLAVTRGAWAAGDDVLRVGVIGCGGRGTGAALNALEASPRVRITALADVFRDRVDGCREHLATAGERAAVPDDRCHVGFDAYRGLIAGDVDVVILATPPHFRPMHLAAAVAAGRHVFMEKPVAVDPAGIRAVLAAADEADAKGLTVVAGTQRRHEACYRAIMERIHDGDIGRITAARCYWNMGGLWMHEPRDEWTDMEWQLRNWLYFTWLSGDHIVEQHVHNLDVVNWAVGAHPVRAMGMGGRQVRTHPNYGNIFDHFAIDYEYPEDVHVLSMCRQTDGCAARVEESLVGTTGRTLTRPGLAVIEGDAAWRYEGDNPNPYVQEHRDLLASLDGGERLNEARTVAESTLTAIMGRMSAYTGQVVTWEQAMESSLDLTPPAYEFGDLDVRPVAVPGRTAFV
ncbi:MAG: Gfo/Idh/MocA family protein [Planctomycetota bacterium]|jgi:predicted dehydrogenase